MKSFSPSSTAFRKWCPACSFVANSSRVYKVGFTGRPSRASAQRSAGVRSANPTSPMTMRSTSLEAVSVARAIEP